jgi:UDP-3-O-[3-hydroxymyristoyl] glucosamine N-acyltransferase
VADVALREIAEQLGGELIGDGERRIDRIGSLDKATPSTVTFLANPRLRPQLAASKAGCVIVGEADREAAIRRGATLVTDDPYLAYARLTRWWVARTRPAAQASVHPSAVVAADARVAADATIGPFTLIESGADIGPGAIVGAHCAIGANSRLGAQTRLAARVTLYAGVILGARCIVHSGAVIGADGFGFAPVDDRWEKIEQLGGVRIGDDVEIGANTCIDRGAIDDTVIEDGAKLDNQIQIGHNTRIGAHTAIAGCVGIAGSADIGAHCTIGGAAMILGHLRIGDRVNISAASVVMRSIAKPGLYSGVFPIDDNAAWEKNAATLRQLHGLRDRLRSLEKKAAREATP